MSASTRASQVPVATPQERVGAFLVRFTGADAPAPRPHDVEVVRGAALRVAPLLEVAAVEDGHIVVVGRTSVLADSAGALSLDVHVEGTWATGEFAARLTAEDDGARRRTYGEVDNWQRVDDARADREQLLRTALAGVDAPPAGDPEARATMVAKTLAERSRGAVADLRRLRYQLERLLSGELRKASTRTLERLLADLLELSNAAGVARDQARECAREGLWSWRSDPSAYHEQRRRQDPTLAPRPGRRRRTRRDWLHTLDAGIRQCQAMDGLLADEAAALRGLLGATSTMSVTRDARSSETFNLVASVGGIMLGLPALVLTLYGASSVLPLNTSNIVVLIPLAIAGLAASVIAAFLPGRERTGKLRRFTAALSAVVLTLLLLTIAGALVHPDRSSPPAPSPAVPAPATPGR